MRGMDIFTHRGLLALLLLAFAMNVMLPFFAVYDVNQAFVSKQEARSESQLASLFDGKVLICTANGFEWVSLKDLQSGKQTPAPHPKYECALCYVAANSIKFTLPERVADTTYRELSQSIAYAITGPDTWHVRHLAGAYSSRAPPLFIVG